MPPAFHDAARHILPNLTAENYRITSPPSWDYNCIGWAVGDTDVWWWPIPGRFWPDGVPREETLDAFVAALATRGFAPCANSDLETTLEKIALYAVGTIPTHAARQLATGWWTSKLGPSIDIEQVDLQTIAGGVYGTAGAFLARQRSE